MIEITKWWPLPWKQYKKNLLEGTKQQRTRIITKSNLKKSCEDNRHVLKQRCDSKRQKRSSFETLHIKK